MEDLKIFAKTIEPEATEQVYRMAKSDAYKDCTIRIMPDCHAGKGCTVGTVIKIHDKVVPNTVGVDIGCGMLVIGLGPIDVDVEKLDDVINTKVPYGFASHERAIISYTDCVELRCAKHINLGNALRQIGTLGGGNHFIEVNESDSGYKYLVIHSGSRHLGVEVCEYYQNMAYKSLNEMSTIRRELVDRLKREGRAKDIDKELKALKKPSCDKELAFLTGKDMADYLHDMNVVQHYASINRSTMAEIIVRAMGWQSRSAFETIHNYINIEKGVLRKGAVSANEGELLIIPINMRDGSLICEGKGNEDWLCSAPHGAGRLMSRAKAKSMLSMEEFKQEMSGVYSTSVCESTIDESPMAYKSMDEIVECIEPTVEIIQRIRPIYNFKAK